MEGEFTAKLIDLCGEALKDKASALLSELVQKVDLSAAAPQIQKGAEYVVSVPVEYQEGLNNGLYSLMKNSKTGAIYPKLMKIVEGTNGKKEIVKNLEIIERPAVAAGAPQVAQVQVELSPVALTMISDILMQKQLADLRAEVKEISVQVSHVLRGQENDRRAQVESGMKLIESAFLAKNGLDVMELSNGRAQLDEGNSKVFEDLKTKVEEFVPLPKTSIRRQAKMLIKPATFAKADKAYEDIRKLYELFCYGVRELTASYLAVNEKAQAENAFSVARKALAEIDWSKLDSIRYIHESSEQDYSYLSEYATDELEEGYHAMLNTALPCNVIEYKVPGKLLLEAINNGR